MFSNRFIKVENWTRFVLIAFVIFVFLLTLDQMLALSRSKTIVQNELKRPHIPTLAERLGEKLKCHDNELRMEKIQYGSFWLLQNLIVGSVSNTVSCAETITYTTNSDYTFIGNLPMVLESWLAPVSFALFTPGNDLEKTMESIQYARNCLPERDIIRKYVSFHIYFPNDHMPQRVPINRQAALSWTYNCKAPAPYLNVDRQKMYKTASNLTYPINVGRNIARRAVNTYFIFASDIELIPSPNIPKMFLEMVDRNMSLIQQNNGMRVFTLPVFEVESNAKVPKTKDELKTMMTQKIAIPFHAKICKNCHLVPNHDKWLNTTETEGLHITAVAKREGKFVYWEPFYISNNQEPIFDERVTWEGQSNKRIQNYAMCLLGYEYLVVHPSFLVHSPGIKKFEKSRTKMVPATNKLIREVIQPEYEVLFGKNPKCQT